jgi:hypothetical protein
MRRVLSSQLSDFESMMPRRLGQSPAPAAACHKYDHNNLMAFRPMIAGMNALSIRKGW